MSFRSLLAPRQKIVWSLRRSGLEPVEIAKKLNASRQFVHQTLNAADAKLSGLLTEEARASRIEIQHLDVKSGILVGYHRGLGTRAVISYSGEHGVQVWYWHENAEACKACELLHQCKSYLLDEARERGIPLAPNEMEMLPAKLAHVVFSRLIPGLRP